MLCDPGQVAASLWAPEPSSVNKEFKDLFRDLLSNRLVDLTEECHILSEEIVLGPRMLPCSPDVHENRFDLSANPLGCTEQQPACSASLWRTWAPAAKGAVPVPLVVLIPPPNPHSASVLGSGRKTQLVSHCILPFLYWPILVRLWSDCL